MTTTSTPLTTAPAATPAQALAAQNYRYATKAFDATRKLTAAQWQVLEQTLVLSPSSYGLQPWKFMNVSNLALRAELRKVSWNQAQVTDASHLIVFLSRTTMEEADVNKFIARTSEVRGIPADKLEDYKQLMYGDIVHGPRSKTASEWAARQTYLAFANLMTTSAFMGIDTCPLEGLDPIAYDKILQVPAGYRTLAAVAIGYRSTSDKYATLPKVRYNANEVIINK